MASLVVLMVMPPAGYLLSNVASVIDGKGLRLLGGVMDAALLTGTSVAVVAIESYALETLARTFPSVEDLVKQSDNRSASRVQFAVMGAIAIASVGGAYAGAKRLLMSPTSTTADFLTGSVFVGTPILALLAAS